MLDFGPLVFWTLIPPNTLKRAAGGLNFIIMGDLLVGIVEPVNRSDCHAEPDKVTIILDEVLWFPPTALSSYWTPFRQFEIW